MARDFKNIKAWRFADELAVKVYSVTKSFPREELYGITSQLRRAVVSVPANIAEGASRDHQKEYLYFLNIAKGSIAEVAYLLHLSNRLDYLKDSDYTGLEELRTETAKTLYGLIKSVKKETEETTIVS
ncbi:MAG: four helix bundle protein [Sedimentisphaerales bacterium]|nr:four helix bundle protein [Sedimentisphaerales bacterium]